MSIHRQVLTFILLSVLVLCMLPSSRADVVIAANTQFNYASGTGATAVIVTLADYTFASPVSLTNATQTPPLGELYFNLTGKTTGLPTGQLQLQVWNTSDTGTVPITLETATVRATYVLNATNYSYSNPNITINTLLSNQTVTVDFNLLGSHAIYVYQSTGTMAVAPTYAGNILTFVVADSGAGAATQTFVTGPGARPDTESLNGAPPAPAAVTYVAGSDMLTLTGLGTWVLDYHAGATAGLLGTGSTSSVDLSILSESITVTAGTVADRAITSQLKASRICVIQSITSSQPWLFAVKLPLQFSPPAGGQVGTALMPIRINATNLAPGEYKVSLTIHWAVGVALVDTYKVILVKVVPAEASSPPLITLPNLPNLSMDPRIPLAGLILGLIGVNLFIRRRRNHSTSA